MFLKYTSIKTMRPYHFNQLMFWLQGGQVHAYGKSYEASCISGQRPRDRFPSLRTACAGFQIPPPSYSLPLKKLCKYFISLLRHIFNKLKLAHSKPIMSYYSPTTQIFMIEYLEAFGRVMQVSRISNSLPSSSRARSVSPEQLPTLLSGLFCTVTYNQGKKVHQSIPIP